MLVVLLSLVLQADDGGAPLEKAVIRRVLQRAHTLACFDEALQRAPDATVFKVVVRFVVTPDGAVATTSVVRASPDDPRLGECLMAKVRALRFPAAGATSVVEFPFRADTRGH